MAALLGNDLILDLHGGDAGADELLHGSVQVDGVAVAGVDVADNRRFHHGGHLPHLLEHLRHRHQPDVGQRELAVRNAGAGRVDDREAGEFDEPCGQPVVGAGRDDQRVACEQLSENSGLRHS